MLSVRNKTVKKIQKNLRVWNNFYPGTTIEEVSN